MGPPMKGRRSRGSSLTCSSLCTCSGSRPAHCRHMVRRCTQRWRGAAAVALSASTIEQVREEVVHTAQPGARCSSACLRRSQ
eukprot:4040244-Ditylum_brightwellii.AAC.1